MHVWASKEKVTDLILAYVSTYNRLPEGEDGGGIIMARRTPDSGASATDDPHSFKRVMAKRGILVVISSNKMSTNPSMEEKRQGEPHRMSQGFVTLKDLLEDSQADARL